MKNIFCLISALILTAFSAVGQRTLPHINIQDSVNIVGDDPKILLNGVEFEGGTTYNGNSPTTITVGGLNAGSVITGESIIDLLESILVPYIAPTFSSFSISGQPTVIEVGDSVFDDKTFTWAFTNSSNVQANSLDIYEISAGGRYLETNISIISPAVTNVGKVKYSTATTHSYRAEATNTQGNTFLSASFSISWRFYRYVGFSVSENPADATIQAFTKEFDTERTDASANYTNSTGGSAYFVIAYPASWGTATIKKDGFVLSNFTLTTRDFINASGHTESYNIYVSNDPTAGNYTGVSIE